MKKTFEKPELNIINVESEDIIVTSGLFMFGDWFKGGAAEIEIG